ncbi:MAG: Nickel uptake substrate-specific transmembrane region [Bacteroidetes bacterium]|nr:Nickel uptake substrate-specific transmembrane region [Bacteroidota bacterium]
MKLFHTVVVSCLVVSSLTAHDFFLYASRFSAKPGDRVKIKIHVHELFPGEAVKWNPQRILRFEHRLGKTMSDGKAVKPEADSSGVTFKLDQVGLHSFALDWAARFIDIKPDLFAKYLASEGLDHVLKLRKERGEETKNGRERYSRYVKTLINAGDGNSESLDKVAGQTIELVPLDNPYSKKVGDAIRVQLLFRGKPLVNNLISSTYVGASDKPDTYAQSARTDENGLATVRLTHSGPWLVRTVHMLPLTDSKDADWESWWASITFEVR